MQCLFVTDRLNGCFFTHWFMPPRPLEVHGSQKKNRRTRSPSCEMKAGWSSSKACSLERERERERERVCQKILSSVSVSQGDESHFFPFIKSSNPPNYAADLVDSNLKRHGFQTLECHWLDQYWGSNDWRLPLSKQSFGINGFKQDNWSQTSLSTQCQYNLELEMSFWQPA